MNKLTAAWKAFGARLKEMGVNADEEIETIAGIDETAEQLGIETKSEDTTDMPTIEEITSVVKAEFGTMATELMAKIDARIAEATKDLATATAVTEAVTTVKSEMAEKLDAIASDVAAAKAEVATAAEKSAQAAEDVTALKSEIVAKSQPAPGEGAATEDMKKMVAGNGGGKASLFAYSSIR